MKKFALVLAVVASAYAASGFAQSTPSAVFAELVKARNEKITAARKADPRGDITPILDEFKDKAKEAASKFDADKIDVKECLALAQLWTLASDDAKACHSAERFVASKPSDDDLYRGYSIILASCDRLGEAKMLAETLASYVPKKDDQKVMLATMTALQYSDTISEKLGVDEAVKVLDAQLERIRQLKLSEDGAKLRDNAVLGIATQKAELLFGAGRKEEAIKIADAAIAEFGDSPAVRSLKGMKTRFGLVGSPAPAFPFERGQGNFSGLDNWKGKVVIVDFMAHWCPPCIASIPDMREMLADLQPKGLEIVSFTTYYGYYQDLNREKRDMDKDTEFGHLKDFIAEKNMTWPVVCGERSVFDAYGVTSIPQAVIIDRKGVIQHVEVGYTKEMFLEFRKKVEAILAG